MKIGVVHVTTEAASGPYTELVTANLERAAVARVEHAPLAHLGLDPIPLLGGDRAGDHRTAVLGQHPLAIGDVLEPPARSVSITSIRTPSANAIGQMRIGVVALAARARDAPIPEM